MVPFPTKEELVNQLVILVGYRGCTLPSHVFAWLVGAMPRRGEVAMKCAGRWQLPQWR